MMADFRELAETLISVARLSGVTLEPTDITIESLPAPHKRPRGIPSGKQVVYAFFLGSCCLKVGKAGPKTQARFTSQHYGENAPSTLAKSILKEKSLMSGLLEDGRRNEIEFLTSDSVGRWIETNTARVHVFIPVSVGSFILGLFESFLQCRFNPLFECKSQETSVGA
jgi:hypothetical protein